MNKGLWGLLRSTQIEIQMSLLWLVARRGRNSGRVFLSMNKTTTIWNQVVEENLNVSSVFIVGFSLLNECYLLDILYSLYMYSCT